MDNQAKIEKIKKDYTMTIRTVTGPIELVGQKHELMKFRDILKDQKNRHVFLECPPWLLTWAPWLIGISVKPIDITAIIIQDKEIAPKMSNAIAVPGRGFGRGPMAMS